MVRAADASLQNNLAEIMTFGLVELYKNSIIQILLTALRKMGTECVEKFQYTEARLAFVKPRYLTEGYISTIADIDLD